MKRFYLGMLILLATLLGTNAYAQKAPEDSLTKAIKHNMRMVQLAVEDYASQNNGVYPTKVTDFLPLLNKINIKNPVDSRLSVVVDGSSNKPGQVVFKRMENLYEVTGNDAKCQAVKVKLSGKISGSIKNITQNKTMAQKEEKKENVFVKMFQDTSTTESASVYKKYLTDEYKDKRGIVAYRLGKLKDPVATDMLISITNDLTEKKDVKDMAMEAIFANTGRRVKNSAIVDILTNHEVKGRVFNKIVTYIVFNYYGGRNIYIKDMHDIDTLYPPIMRDRLKPNTINESLYNAILQYINNNIVKQNYDYQNASFILAAADNIKPEKRAIDLWNIAEILIGNDKPYNYLNPKLGEYPFINPLCVSLIPRTKGAIKGLSGKTTVLQGIKMEWLLLTLTLSGEKKYKQDVINIAVDTTRDDVIRRTAYLALGEFKDNKVVQVLKEELKRQKYKITKDNSKLISSIHSALLKNNIIVKYIGSDRSDISLEEK